MPDGDALIGHDNEDGDAGRQEAKEAEVAALVLRYQSGEHGALAALYQQLERPILSFLRGYRSSDLPALVSLQDLRQQSWIILAELAGRWKPHGSFLAYMFRSFPREIQRYVVRARQSEPARRMRIVTLPHDELMAHAAGLQDQSGATEAAVLSRELLESLPPRLRAAFVLRAVDGQDFGSIARALGVSRATAHRLYRSALERLDVSESGAPRERPPATQ
jgi:RNA polymerase sigma factor (sigma-70 family)